MTIQIYNVDGSPKVEPEPKKPDPINCKGEHCWHYDREQHSVPSHSDWRCCYCNAQMCRRGFRSFLDHGPFIDDVHPHIILGFAFQREGRPEVCLEDGHYFGSDPIKSALCLRCGAPAPEEKEDAHA